MSKSIEQKVFEEFPEFCEECSLLSADELKNRISGLATGAEDTRNAREEDEELANARELANGLNAPYVDALKALRLKTRYLIQLLKEKGGA